MKVVSSHDCKFKCSTKINDTEQNAIHSEFYSMTAHEKRLFILNSSVVNESKRTKSDSPKRKQSFSYFFSLESEKIRVCKKFFLEVLDVSQKMVYTTHQNKNSLTGTPKQEGRGKGTKERLVESKLFAKEHIASFPAVESHYCRAKTSKTYIEGGLNVARMYSLYKEVCTAQERQPVKESMYRDIFNTCFNIAFIKPKTDRCDLCEEFRVRKATNIFTDEDSTKENAHLVKKNSMRSERNQDKSSLSENEALVCFDLQNVITCPKVEIGSFFYKRKLNCYNLTGHVTTKKTQRCLLCFVDRVSCRKGWKRHRKCSLQNVRKTL